MIFDLTAWPFGFHRLPLRQSHISKRRKWQSPGLLLGLRLRLVSFSRAWKGLRRAGTGTRTRRWAPIRCGELCSASDALCLQWWPHESISDATTSELRKVRFHCLLRSRLHRCIPCHCPPATSASAAATSGSASLAASASLAGGGERCCTGRAARQLSARREGPLSAPPPSALELS